MERVIELLERAMANTVPTTGVKPASGDMNLFTEAISYLNEAISYLNEAIAELKTPPRWETPERWKERTGKEWPNNAAVSYSTSDHGWYADTYSLARILSMTSSVQIICATEAGPPPDDWKPEEAR
jgi:hypothetical protein